MVRLLLIAASLVAAVYAKDEKGNTEIAYSCSKTRHYFCSFFLISFQHSVSFRLLLSKMKTAKVKTTRL